MSHLDDVRLRPAVPADARVFTIEAVAAKIGEDAPALAERITVVTPGEAFDVDGLPIKAVGEMHAVIHPELPRFHNSGFVITAGTEKVFHPGDALTGPDEYVDVLLAPVCAPWMRVSEGVDFARAVGAPRNLAIHDRIFSDAGLGIVDTQMNAFLPKQGLSFVRLADGEDLA